MSSLSDDGTLREYGFADGSVEDAVVFSDATKGAQDKNQCRVLYPLTRPTDGIS
jgi:hypothetical protein